MDDPIGSGPHCLFYLPYKQNRTTLQCSSFSFIYTLAHTMQYLTDCELQTLTWLHTEHTFFLFLFCNVDYLLTFYLNCSIWAVIHKPIWSQQLVWNSPGIWPVFHCCQQSLCPKTIWQPDHAFWGTDWKLALCNYIYWCLRSAAIRSRIWHNIHWCLWSAAIHSHVWHPILLSVRELYTSLRCIPHSCLWCHILWYVLYSLSLVHHADHTRLS
jgi:hypothetical protein